MINRLLMETFQPEFFFSHYLVASCENEIALQKKKKIIFKTQLEKMGTYI